MSSRLSQSASLPTREQELDLHRRLIGNDPIAPSDLAVAYLDHLIGWLAENNPRLGPEMHAEAASEAICSLIKRPQSYMPDRQTLVVYLQLSAQGDLKNVLRREGRHHRRRATMESVELSPDAGKYLGREADPSLPLQIEEARSALRAEISEILPLVQQGLSEPELRVLELMLNGERKTSVFAEAFGISHLSVDEQKSEVKRIKDRLRKRVDRATSHNDNSP